MTHEKVAPGKLVVLTYSIRDDQGRILEQSDLPVTYIHGGQVELVGGLDRHIEGCPAGEEVELTLSPDAGFGRHDPGLTFTDDLANVPPEFRFVGAEVPMQSDSGEERTFIVTRIEHGRLTVDGNHPLAGKTLRVRVRIVEVREPTAAEWAEQGPGSAFSLGTH
jgi:FKBP-type peptidyl-prolyl cis-trans isomerase SlyD